MFSRLRMFTPPEFPVLSLEVQAHMPVEDVREQSQFHLLVRHFLERFFNNEMVSAEGDAKTHFLQVVYAIALPGMVVALFLFPLYHAPLPRPFWSQVSDHYFYVLYSFVGVGAVSLFAWDLLFPDLIDVFVLTPLPVVHRRLFLARTAAASLFLGLFLVGSSALGSIFYPLLSETPGLARHLTAHLLAVLGGGAFAAALFLGVQGVDGHSHGGTPFPHHFTFPAGHLDDDAADDTVAFPGHVPIPSSADEFAGRPIFSTVLVFGSIRGSSGRV